MFSGFPVSGEFRCFLRKLSTGSGILKATVRSCKEYHRTKGLQFIVQLINRDGFVEVKSFWLYLQIRCIVEVPVMHQTLSTQFECSSRAFCGPSKHPMKGNAIMMCSCIEDSTW